jgi:sodium/bile acid cotransporter 7
MRLLLLPVDCMPLLPCDCFAGAIAYGLASILLLTPLLGLAVVQLPLQPPALALGLGVFCCMPTALSSGVTFTQVRAGFDGCNAKLVVPLHLLLCLHSCEQLLLCCSCQYL